MVGDYKYPLYARAIGWLVAALPLIPIPVCALHVVRKSPGNTWFQVKTIYSDFLYIYIYTFFLIVISNFYIKKTLSLSNLSISREISGIYLS